jgi:hypothetical protein
VLPLDKRAAASHSLDRTASQPLNRALSRSRLETSILIRTHPARPPRAGVESSTPGNTAPHDGETEPARFSSGAAALVREADRDSGGACEGPGLHRLQALKLLEIGLFLIMEATRDRTVS